MIEINIYLKHHTLSLYLIMNCIEFVSIIIDICIHRFPLFPTLYFRSISLTIPYTSDCLLNKTRPNHII